MWYVNGNHLASTPAAPGHDHSEHCESCDRETLQEVVIQIREESDDPTDAQFSREPYRVATCTRGGTERARRMNNA